MILCNKSYKTYSLVYTVAYSYFLNNPLLKGENMKSTSKSEALLRDVADHLRIRFANSATIDTVREARDSQGWPMLFCSDAANEAAGQPVIAIRIRAVDAVSKDVFGNDLVAFAPHALEIAYELTAANNPIPADADILKAEFEAIKTGVKIQLKELANGTAVTAANMDSAAADMEIEDLNWPTKGV